MANFIQSIVNNMVYTYKNITKTNQLLTLVSNQHNSVSHITVGVGATIELSYPGLDMYLPHILARLDEGKNNITATVLRNNATAASVKPTTKPVANTSSSSNSPTIVKPGIYVNKTTDTVVAATTKVSAKATPAVPAIKAEQAVVVETPAEADAVKKA